MTPTPGYIAPVPFYYCIIVSNADYAKQLNENTPALDVAWQAKWRPPYY
jgi:hypothetical protein